MKRSKKDRPVTLKEEKSLIVLEKELENFTAKTKIPSRMGF